MPDDTFSSDDLIQKADRLQQGALEAIRATGVQTLWGKVGKVFRVGSSRFGLMASPNIDFEVYVDAPNARDGFAVMREIAAVPGVRRIDYYNFLGSDDPGLYWRWEYEDPSGFVWDFDNWLVPFSHPYAGIADALAEAVGARMTPELRKIILSLKNRTLDWTPKPRGIDIYMAVMRDGVWELDAFRDWFETHPRGAIETWRPE
ncbi:MAG: hypothetical protein PHE27_07145 [Alphaproteobacteria bacterium]|nr:hypothetical protein [Alphaproteobacteria bacterium]